MDLIGFFYTAVLHFARKMGVFGITWEAPNIVYPVIKYSLAQVS